MALCAVIGYTSVAAWQSYLIEENTTVSQLATQQILEADTRPYVGAFLHTDYFGTKDANLDFAPGKPLQLGISFYDYGKLPADTRVRAIVTYSTKRRSRSEPIPNTWRHFEIWPQQVNGNALKQGDHAEGITDITDSEAASIRQGNGFVYVAIEIRYSKYVTLICKEYSVSEARNIVGNTLPLPYPKMCQDSASNYAD